MLDKDLKNTINTYDKVFSLCSSHCDAINENMFIKLTKHIDMKLIKLVSIEMYIYLIILT